MAGQRDTGSIHGDYGNFDVLWRGALDAIIADWDSSSVPLTNNSNVQQPSSHKPTVSKIRYNIRVLEYEICVSPLSSCPMVKKWSSLTHTSIMFLFRLPSIMN